MVSYPSINLVDSIIDEVALEGLDGITLEALWLRIAHRFHSSLPLPKPFMNQIWSICVQVREFSFYELQVPRKMLIIFDRYEFVDPDLGIILEPDDVPPDIYPHCPIFDSVNNVKGSCCTYYTRKDITNIARSMNLDEASNKYKQKLVIVASQRAREHALVGIEICPTLELNVTQYCFLERVGRSRYHGEVTQGKLSLSALREDPKSLFYHRKFLLRHKLVTKQIHHQKTSGHSCNGSLLHLPRFFVERKPKVIFLAEQVIEILKSRPNCIAEYDEIKRKLQIENSIKKLFKTAFFQKVVRTDLRVPYRTLYPNATPTEWQQKNNPTKEKMIKVVQLLVPDIDITEMWNKDEVQEEDDPQEMDISKHKYNVPYLKQANIIIEQNKSDGVCQGGLGREMGLTKLQARTLLRNMVKTKMVATYMNDMGRQRLTKFVSKRFEEGSKMSKQFKMEMCKIKELTKHIVNENGVFEKNKSDVVQEVKNICCIDQDVQVNDTEEMNKPHVTETIDTNNLVSEENEQAVIGAAELDNLYCIINRILHKYRLTKYITQYRRSFNNVSKNVRGKKESKSKSTSDKDDFLISELSYNQKASSIYKAMKTDLIAIRPSNRRKPVHEVFGFMEDVQNIEKNNMTNITYRLLRRANMIIESVKQHQVIDDMTKLMKMIQEEEDREGYDVKIDKKSLIRLLQKLAKDNLVKSIRLTLSGNGREKNLTFICDPAIDIDHAVIQSSVEQAKLKFCLLESQRINKPLMRRFTNTLECGTDSFSNESNPLSRHLISSANYKYDPKAAKRYGYNPKFLRMQVLHIFLYYLVYDHPGNQTLSKKEQIAVLRSKGFKITEELEEECSTLYGTDINWKMFVPPLPRYAGWPKGWTLMCDVLLRIPVSIFLKIHSVPFVIPDLNGYLNHPIRKHYLVRDLPAYIRNTLLYARKYIFNIHQTVMRLCYVGLIQFGPQRLKEKDQVFIYVNRYTELMDTTSSAPSYHNIEDKSYPVTRYKFEQIQTVEKYWYDMWNTCINTPLGGRLVVQGKDILLEELSKKTEMIKAVGARSPEEAIRLDTGQVPGDRKGAAGIDSAFFAHLKRNWNWSIGNNTATSRKLKNSREGVVYERDAYLSKIKAKPLKFTEFSGLKKVFGPPSVSAVELKRKSQKQYCLKNEKENRQKYEMLIFHRSAKQKSFVRRVLPRKVKSRRRKKYDEIDFRALQRMHKLRVDWEPHEDKILLVCKVVMMYLCSNPRKQVVTFTAVRDILRSYSFSSYNKTSRACQRRLLYMLRQPQTINSVALGVEEIKQNFFIRKRFDGIVDKLRDECKTPHEHERRMTEVFKTLVGYVAKKYYDISEVGPSQPLSVPKTAQEFNILYKTVHPAKPFNSRGFVKDVRTINDVHSAAINSVIHSSMCCGKDRRSWAYQLFKVYQQYPEILLRNAMMKIRSDQVVTIKKNHMCAIKKYGNYMPMSSSQYQLSSNYIYKFQAKWPYNVFNETYNFFFKLIQWYSQNRMNNQNDEPEKINGTEILPVTGGTVTAIQDYFIQNQIDFDIEIPEQIIMLDPRLKEKDETYFRIAQRYQDVLVSLDHLKMTTAESTPSNVKTSELLSSNEENNYCNCNRGSRKRKNLSTLEGDDVIPTAKCIRCNKLFENTKSMTSCDDLNIDSDGENFYNTVGEESKTNFQGELQVTSNQNSTEDSKFHVENSTVAFKKFLSVDEINSRSNIENSILPVSERNQQDEHSDVDEPAPKRRRYNETTTIFDNIYEECKEKSPIGTDINPDDETVNNDNDSSNISHDDTEKKYKSDNGTITKRTKKGSGCTYTRVSDLLRNISPEKSYLSPYCKLDDTSDIQKRYTRIALLRMREELNELTVADSHHAQEYFVVNMFKIWYSLSTSDLQNFDETETFKNFTIPSKCIPFRSSTTNELVREINRYAVFPKHNISYTDFKNTFSNNMPANLKDIDAVYNFVREKKEIGANIHELITEFQDFLEEDLYRIVTLLTENYLFLRSGVTTIRYIHYRYANPWLIRSYKIHRLEKEALPPIPRGSVYLTEPTADINTNTVGELKKHQNLSSGTLAEELPTSTKQLKLNKTNNEKEHVDKGHTSNSEDEGDSNVKKKFHRKRTRLFPQRDISRSAKQLDFTTAEEIKVVIKPWIRIDGVLNRRVLDRMLGAVLTYCLTHPGITLAKVQSRFVPALQPFHTRELVEMLIKLQCLDRKFLQKPRVTLFSKPSSIRPKNINHDCAAESDIFLEPASGAMLKFGIFLSSKMYSTDFIA